MFTIKSQVAIVEQALRTALQAAVPPPLQEIASQVGIGQTLRYVTDSLRSARKLQIGDELKPGHPALSQEDLSAQGPG